MNTLDEKVIKFEASDSGIELKVNFDPEAQTISEVFARTNASEHEAALGRLKHVLTGLPVDEAAQHGGLKFEFACRDLSIRKPVSGIMLVNNAESIFDTVTKLIRDVCSQYQVTYKPKRGLNFYHESISDAWSNLTNEERKAKIEATVKSFLPSVDESSEAIKISQIERSTKIYVIYQSEGSVAKRGQVLMDLERKLRTELEWNLEIFQEEIQDFNSRRFTKED